MHAYIDLNASEKKSKLFNLKKVPMSCPKEKKGIIIIRKYKIIINFNFYWSESKYSILVIIKKKFLWMMEQKKISH